MKSVLGKTSRKEVHSKDLSLFPVCRHLIKALQSSSDGLYKPSRSLILSNMMLMDNQHAFTGPYET